MTVLILHGTWVRAAAGEAGGQPGDPHDGYFFAWAERVPAGRRGRRPSGSPKAGAPHPFQARPEEVRDALLALSPALARQVERTVWRLVRQQIRLPTRDTAPLHSPEAARVVAALGEDDGARERGSERATQLFSRSLALSLPRSPPRSEAASARTLPTSSGASSASA